MNYTDIEVLRTPPILPSDCTVCLYLDSSLCGVHSRQALRKSEMTLTR